MIKSFIKLLRRFRLVYWLLNIENLALLTKNKAVYRHLGIRKPVHFALQNKDVEHLPEHKMGIDNALYFETICQNKTALDALGLTSDDIRFFESNGFLILKAFFSQAEVAQINHEIESKIASGEFHFNFTGKKIPFAFKHSAVLKNIALNERLLNINSLLLGKTVFPYHTLNFIQGSEQAPHSDAIHMGTYPQGGLIAAWMALEPTDADNGPLLYYPGSHKLPYIKNADLGLKENKFFLDENPNAKYEKKIQEVLVENNLQALEFYADKGDVLIWHGNLVHGGKKMLDKNRTRKSMVIHYLREDTLCWHELSQRPALVEKII